ncbi:unnamed protein product, partial [Closterium sp. NIES-54]
RTSCTQPRSITSFTSPRRPLRLLPFHHPLPPLTAPPHLLPVSTIPGARQAIRGHVQSALVQSFVPTTLPPPTNLPTPLHRFQPSLPQHQELDKLYAATFDQLVHFIETASAPILAVDREGCITGWNNKVATLTGLPFSAAIGKSLVDDLADVQSKTQLHAALDLAFQGLPFSSAIRKSLVDDLADVQSKTQLHVALDLAFQDVQSKTQLHAALDLAFQVSLGVHQGSAASPAPQSTPFYHPMLFLAPSPPSNSPVSHAGREAHNIQLRLHSWGTERSLSGQGPLLKKPLLLLYPSSPPFPSPTKPSPFTGREAHNIQLRLHSWGTERSLSGPSARTASTGSAAAAAAASATAAAGSTAGAGAEALGIDVGSSVILLANTFVSRDAQQEVQGVCFVGQDVTVERVVNDQFRKVKGDYEAIVHAHSSLIPPIFGCDAVSGGMAGSGGVAGRGAAGGAGGVLRGAGRDYEAIVHAHSSLIPPIFGCDGELFERPGVVVAVMGSVGVASLGCARSGTRQWSESRGPLPPLHTLLSPSFPSSLTFETSQKPPPFPPPLPPQAEFGLCTEWNAAMERITGFTRFEVWERMLIGDVFGSLCRMESGDAMTKLMIVISKAMAGHEAVKVPFSFLNRQALSGWELGCWRLLLSPHRLSGTPMSQPLLPSSQTPSTTLHPQRTLMELLLSVHPRHSADGNSVVGAFCFLHTASLELRQAVDKQKTAEKLASDKARQVAYVREMSRGPLDGLAYSFARMEQMGAGFSGKQLPWVRTGVALETQLRKIVSDTDMLAIEQGQAPLATLPFTMETTCGAVISQATLLALKSPLYSCCLCTSLLLLPLPPPHLILFLHLFPPPPSLPQLHSQAPLATLPFTMETVCGAVISQATLLATHKGAKLTLELGSDVKTLPLCGDAPRLQQILGGLLCAAVSHTQATGLVKLEVTQKGSRLFRGTTTMAELDIRISHTGRGLPEEIINQMFDSNAATTSTATATTTPTYAAADGASAAIPAADRSFGINLLPFFTPLFLSLSPFHSQNLLHGAEIINQMFDSNAATTSTATATTTTATTPTAASASVSAGDRSFGRASSDGGGSVGGMSVGGMSTGSGALRSNAEGVLLSLIRRMLKSMKGEVVYTREAGRCFFWVHVDFPLSSALRWGGAAAAGAAAGGAAAGGIVGAVAAGAPAAL